MLSEQFEQDAKLDSIRRKANQKKKKNQVTEKLELEIKNRSGSDDSQKTYYNTNNTLVDHNNLASTITLPNRRKVN